MLGEPIVLARPWSELVDKVAADDVGKEVVCLLDVGNRACMALTSRVMNAK